MTQENRLTPLEFLKLWEGHFPSIPRHKVGSAEVYVHVGDFRTCPEEEEWVVDLYTEEEVSEFLAKLYIVEHFYETRHIKSKYSDFGEKWLVVWLEPNGVAQGGVDMQDPMSFDGFIEAKAEAVHKDMIRALKKELFLLSAMARDGAIQSMARVADISAYNPGDAVPAFDMDPVTGADIPLAPVIVPAEFYPLRDLGGRISVWFFNDSVTRAVSHAYRVQVTGAFQVPGVRDASFQNVTESSGCLT